MRATGGRKSFELAHVYARRKVILEQTDTLTDYTKIHLRALSSNLVASNHEEDVSFVSKREKEKERNFSFARSFRGRGSFRTGPHDERLYFVGGERAN